MRQQADGGLRAPADDKRTFGVRTVPRLIWGRELTFLSWLNGQHFHPTLQPVRFGYRYRIQNHALQNVSFRTYDRRNYMPEKHVAIAKCEPYVQRLLIREEAGARCRSVRPIGLRAAARLAARARSRD